MQLPEVLETLHLLPNWEERYTFLIELARQLPPMPAADKTAQNLVKGCTSQVWLTHSWQGEKLHLHLDSDALIVKGLLAVIYLAYQGKTKAEVQTTNLTTLLNNTQLLQHLSPNRRNGLTSVNAHIQALAA